MTSGETPREAPPPLDDGDGGLEVSPLVPAPGGVRWNVSEWLGRLGRLPNRPRGWRRTALAVMVIALAVAAPMVALAPTREAVARLFARPTPVAHTSVTVTISTSAPSSAPSAFSPQAWNALSARPLTLPSLTRGARCPAQVAQVVTPDFGPAIGEAPVYLIGVAKDGTLAASSPARFGDGQTAWGGQRVFALIAPGYAGPVLIRGTQLDAHGMLLFNGGLDQMNVYAQAATTLLRQARVEGATASPWAAWGIYLRMQHPGCYGLQIDSSDFSEVVVFRVAFTS